MGRRRVPGRASVDDRGAAGVAVRAAAGDRRHGQPAAHPQGARRACRAVEGSLTLVPKIDAATVAEHRAARRAALLDAAADLLRRTPSGAVARCRRSRALGCPGRASITTSTRARRSWRRVVEETFPRWQRRFDEALATASSPADRVLGVRSREPADSWPTANTLSRGRSRTCCPRHELADRSMVFHAQLTARSVAALTRVGAPNVELHCRTRELHGAHGQRGNLRPEMTSTVVEQASSGSSRPFLDRAACSNRPGDRSRVVTAQRSTYSRDGYRHAVD